MNIGILYGQDVDEQSEDAEVAKEVYDADQVVFVDEITPESINAIKGECGCHSETILIITNENVGDVGFQRRLYSGAPGLMFIQSVKNLRKNYGHLFSVN